jgi:hypothetical protein
MSYHNDNNNNRLHRLTHDQWEIVVDSSNFQRRNVTSGRSVFVNSTGQGESSCTLEARVRELAESLPGPVSWYIDELLLDPPSPDLFLRRNLPELLGGSTVSSRGHRVIPTIGRGRQT